MKLTTYDNIVRHLDKFPKEKIYFSGVDHACIEVTKVRYKNGIEVFGNDKTWHRVEYVMNDMAPEDFLPVKKKRKKKVVIPKEPKKKKITIERAIGDGRAWL